MIEMLATAGAMCLGALLILAGAAIFGSMMSSRLSRQEEKRER